MTISEKLFESCVPAAGGQRVSTLVGVSPEFDNADFIFDGDDVIAEAKSLQKDFLSDPATEEKMHRLLNQWMNQGTVPLAYGRVTISTQQLSTANARELIDLFKEPLGQRLKKANRQIKLIREKLNRPNALGLLLLSNESNMALDPEMTVYILRHLLSTKFSAIEHVIYVSPTLTFIHPQTGQSSYPFFSIRFPGRRQPSDAMVAKLYQSWFSALEGFTGEPLDDLGMSEGNRDEVSKMRFRKTE